MVDSVEFKLLKVGWYSGQDILLLYAPTARGTIEVLAMAGRDSYDPLLWWPFVARSGHLEGIDIGLSPVSYDVVKELILQDPDVRRYEQQIEDED